MQQRIIVCRGGTMKPIKRIAAVIPAQQTWSLVEEFKQFAFKGHVIDLAVAVIIGAAFGKLIDSLVKHILMPLVSVLLPGQQSYLAWKLVVHGTEIPYGLFLGEVVRPASRCCLANGKNLVSPDLDTDPLLLLNEISQLLKLIRNVI